MRLTQAGELLVGHADAILDRLTAAESQLEALSQLKGGRLRIGAPATANATLIPLAVRAFDDEHPEVELRLDEAISSELIERSPPASSTSRSSPTPTASRARPASSCSSP